VEWLVAEASGLNKKTEKRGNGSAQMRDAISLKQSRFARELYAFDRALIFA
jgi:hypothetical protein